MKAIILIFAATVATSLAVNNKKIVCYWGSWSANRSGDGKFDLSYVDPKLCTHMIFSFIGLSPNGQVILLDGANEDNFNRFNKLREQNPALKTMIAIGGWNEGKTPKYSQVVADPNLRHTMVESIVAFVKKYDFDGFDVDWEYPAQRGGSPADKQNYVLLLKELREKFDQEGLILSAAVGATENMASQSYNIPEISKYLDFINLMVYDLRGSWDGKTGFHAAVYAASSESGGDAKLNVDAIINYWLSEGAPSEKLVLGVPFYGKSFTLSSTQSYEVGTPASAGAAGPYVQEGGMLGYNEICEKIKNENWQVKYDEERKAVYAFGGNQWVGYDDEKILKEKTDYIKKHNLGGVMVWSIETDDFRGKCGREWPLLNTLYEELGSEAPPRTKKSPKLNGEALKQLSYQPQPPQQPEEPEQNEWSEMPQSQQYGEPREPEQSEWYETPQPEQYEEPQAPASNGKVCQTEGYVRDPQDCNKYYYCQYFNNEFVEFPFRCSESLVYNPATSVCDWPAAVQC